jgi:hypothetical protein
MKEKNKSTWRPLTTEEQWTLLRDAVQRGGDRQARSMGLWVVETCGLANDAAKEALNDWAVAMFWVRLYGLLHDLRSYWSGVLERTPKDDMVAADLDEVREQAMFALTQVREMVAAIDEVNATLTESERIFIEQRRHFECHPILDDYRVRRTPDGVRDDRKPRLLGGERRSLDEHDDAILEVLGNHAGHKQVAREIALKIQPALHRATALAQALCGV